MVLGRRKENGRNRWLAPKKYWSPKNREISATIEGATDSLVIRLTWDGGKPFSEKSSGSRSRNQSGPGSGLNLPRRDLARQNNA